MSDSILEAAQKDLRDSAAAMEVDLQRVGAALNYLLLDDPLELKVLTAGLRPSTFGGILLDAQKEMGGSPRRAALMVWACLKHMQGCPNCQGLLHGKGIIEPDHLPPLPDMSRVRAAAVPQELLKAITKAILDSDDDDNNGGLPKDLSKWEPKQSH